MAFGGAPVDVWLTRNIKEITGVTLGANVGAYDPTGVAADSGLLTTDLTTPPAGAVLIPTTFGPGEGNWTQADVNVVGVYVEDSSVGADVRVAVAQKALVGGNLQIGIHSLEAGLAGALRVRIDAEHTATR